MTSLISKNVTISRRRTSVRLEPEMWKSLEEVAGYEGCSIHDICTLVALKKKKESSLTSAIRIFLILYYKAASTAEGHIRAGHGSFEKMQKRASIEHKQTFVDEWVSNAISSDIPILAQSGG